MACAPGAARANVDASSTADTPGFGNRLTSHSFAISDLCPGMVRFRSREVDCRYYFCATCQRATTEACETQIDLTLYHYGDQTDQDQGRSSRCFEEDRDLDDGAAGHARRRSP